MRKFIIPAAAAVVLATSALAFAAPRHTDGIIKTFDSKARSLVLDDGSTFMLPKRFKNPGLKAGEKVSVMWDMSGKHKVAESVKIMH